MILVRRDGHKLSFREYKGFVVLCFGTILCLWVYINNMKTRLELVHGIQNDLKREKKRSLYITPHTPRQLTRLTTINAVEIGCKYLSGNNLPRIKVIRGKLFPGRYVLSMTAY